MSQVEKNEENGSFKRKSDSHEIKSDTTVKSPAALDTSKKIKIPIKFSTASVASSVLPPPSLPPSSRSKATEESSEVSLNKSGNSSVEKIETKPLVKQLPSGILASSIKQPIAVVKNVSEKVAKVFGSDDEDEEEEMPIEARMKMRNKGRDTPTSTGPNSYGKTNMGFTDSRKLFEKKLQEKADELLKQEEEKKLKASLNK